MGGSVRQICDTFDKLKFNRLDDGMRIVFVPDENQLQECREYRHKIVAAMEAKEAEAVAADGRLDSIFTANKYFLNRDYRNTENQQETMDEVIKMGKI